MNAGPLRISQFGLLHNHLFICRVIKFFFWEPKQVREIETERENKEKATTDKKEKKNIELKSII